MKLSTDPTLPTREVQRATNRRLRETFGALARTYRAASGLSRVQVSALAKQFAGQGNPTGVRDLEYGTGWVHPRFAEGVFRAVEIPGSAQLGCAYADLKSALGGRVREFD